jgi:hypothetical protein
MHLQIEGRPVRLCGLESQYIMKPAGQSVLLAACILDGEAAHPASTIPSAIVNARLCRASRWFDIIYPHIDQPVISRLPR